MSKMFAHNLIVLQIIHFFFFIIITNATAKLTSFSGRAQYVFVIINFNTMNFLYVIYILRYCLYNFVYYHLKFAKNAL